MDARELNAVAAPYFICGGTVEGGPLYDYGVCGAVERYVDEVLFPAGYSAAISYCDFASDGVVIQGVMTLTIVEEPFVPVVYTFLYEKELNTCE